MDVRALEAYWYKLLRICKIAFVVVDHFWTYVKVNTTSENYFVNRINIVKMDRNSFPLFSYFLLACVLHCCITSKKPCEL